MEGRWSEATRRVVAGAVWARAAVVARVRMAAKSFIVVSGVGE